MSRKHVIAVEKVKRTEFGYDPVEPKVPRETQPTTGTVPVRQYAKREEVRKSGLLGRLRRKPKVKTISEETSDELNRTADILEGRGT